MPRLIGFADMKRFWDGPVTFLFTLYPKEAEKTKTVRYQSLLEKRRFDLYAPKSHLPQQADGGFPPQIVVTVGRSSGQIQTIGFYPAKKPTSVNPDILTYVLDAPEKQPVNSVKYVASEKRSYSLYVPNEVFAGEESPSELFLRISEPDPLLTNLDQILPFITTLPHKS